MQSFSLQNFSRSQYYCPIEQTSDITHRFVCHPHVLAKKKDQWRGTSKGVYYQCIEITALAQMIVMQKCSLYCPFSEKQTRTTISAFICLFACLLFEMFKCCIYICISTRSRHAWSQNRWRCKQTDLRKKDNKKKTNPSTQWIYGDKVYVGKFTRNQNDRIVKAIDVKKRHWNCAQLA